MSDQQKQNAAFFISVVALLAAGASAFYTWKLADIAEKAEARAAGQATATLELIDVFPNSESIPKELRRPIVGGPFTTAYFEDPDTLLRLNMRLILKNVGSRPLDTVRVTVSFDDGFSVTDPGNAGAKDPIITQQVFREDFALDRTAQPTEVIIIPITKGLLSQIVAGQKGKQPEAQRYGEFVVKAYGKVAGGAGFDGIHDDRFIRIRLLWLPKGFSEERSSAILKEFHPNVEIMKTAPKNPTNP